MKRNYNFLNLLYFKPRYYPIKTMTKRDFPGISIIETRWLKAGMGICIPPFGIFVSPGVSHALKQHEYGHFLQYRQMGFWKFYFGVGFPSLWSATFNPRNHHNLKVEKDANQRAVDFFGPDAPVANIRFWPR